jgi:hypothetical protein
MSALKPLILLGILSSFFSGCNKSTLADCEKVGAEVSISGSSAPEFSWEGGPSDEILVSRTGDGVDVWNVYVDSDDADALNQMSSPITYGELPNIEEGEVLVEEIPALDLELGVEYQVQVFVQCEDGGAQGLVGTWSMEE